MGEKYKLTYFNKRGRAESIRLLFACGNVNYEDVRIDQNDWPQIKNKMPWGHVPILEVDGKVISQSFAILRYLAKQFGLYGNDDFQAAQIDEYAYSVQELSEEWAKYFFEADSDMKSELKEILISTHLPKYLEKFSKIQLSNGGGPYLLGEQLTYADVLLANQLDSIDITVESGIVDRYPVMKELKDAVFEIQNVKEYLANRPPS